MSQSNARTSSAHAAAVKSFDLAAWSARLDASALQFTSAAHAMLNLMLEGRGLVEPDTAREKLVHAFASAFCAVNPGVTFEAACKAKSVLNRVSDALCVLKAETLPASLPNNLQQAAAAVRKANPSSRKPRQPSGDKAPVGDVDALVALRAAIEQLRSQATDNAPALELIGELADLAEDVASALAGDADVIEGEVVAA